MVIIFNFRIGCELYQNYQDFDMFANVMKYGLFQKKTNYTFPVEDINIVTDLSMSDVNEWKSEGVKPKFDGKFKGIDFRKF